MIATVEDDVARQLERWIRRMNVPITARKAVKGRGVCLGLTVADGNPCLGSFNTKAEKLILALNKWMHRKVEEAGVPFSWTSIQLNVDTVADLHCDSNNEGPSLIITLGKYTGGEFMIEGSPEVNLQGKVWRFNGNLPHKSFPFTGNRISLIWFAHTSWRRAPQAQIKELKRLGFRLPEYQRGGVRPSSPVEKELELEDISRPVANLSFFEGVGSMAVVLSRLTRNVVAHLSWETDETTKDFLAWRFPAAIPMGDAQATSVREIGETLRRLNIPDETLVVVSGGSPCVDHTRMKAHTARHEEGPEGRKLQSFAKLVRALKEELPWEVGYLVEHVVPWSEKSVTAVNEILGTKAVLVDAADLGLMRKPRIWWTDGVWGPDLCWSRTKLKRCPWRLHVQGITPVPPREVRVGSIGGAKYKLPWQVLNGLALLPCPTRQADAGGWASLPKNDSSDEGTLKRHKEDGRRFAPWHYRESAMLQPLRKGDPLKVLTANVKEQAQMFPQGFLEAPVLNEVLDPERTKANWLANSWHLGVAEFLTKLLLTRSPKDVRERMSLFRESAQAPKWISPWGGSKLDQIKHLIPAFGVKYEALPRRLKMGAARAVWEDRDRERHLRMARNTRHPLQEDAPLESSLAFALTMAEELGPEVNRWRSDLIKELQELVLDMEEELRSWYSRLPAHGKDAYRSKGAVAGCVAWPALRRVGEIMSYPAIKNI